MERYGISKKPPTRGCPPWYHRVSKAALFDALYDYAALATGEADDPEPLKAEAILRNALEPRLRSRGDPIPWAHEEWEDQDDGR